MASPPPAAPPPRPVVDPDLIEKIKETAKKSGKPLEVEVAKSFFEHGKNPALPDEAKWKVWLGSRFDDRTGDKLKELDVLGRLTHCNKAKGASVTTIIDAIVSCKGFPDSDQPVTFSVSRGAVPEYEESIIPEQVKPGVPKSNLGRLAARMLLYQTKQLDDFKAMETRRIEGFDIHREDDKGVVKAMGDRIIYEGLDSAIQASLWWQRRELPPVHEVGEALIRVLVPILVLSKPWLDFAIDDGKVGDPVETHLGSVSQLYPLKGGNHLPTPLLSLVVSCASGNRA